MEVTENMIITSLLNRYLSFAKENFTIWYYEDKAQFEADLCFGWNLKS